MQFCSAAVLSKKDIALSKKHLSKKDNAWSKKHLKKCMIKLRFQISISFKEHKPYSKYLLEKKWSTRIVRNFLQKAIQSKLHIIHSKEV